MQTVIATLKCSLESSRKISLFFHQIRFASERELETYIQCCVCIQTWADAFRGEPELKEFVAVYEELKEKGCEFPMTDLDNIPPIHTPARVTDASFYYILGIRHFFRAEKCFVDYH